MHDDSTTLEARLSRAEGRVRVLTAVSVLLSVVLLLGAVPSGRQDVLRARGLVITDDDGRERIVLGAPMGDASADPKLADAVGVAVLDAEGRLHVSLGADNPLILADGAVGTRIATAAGLTIYDPRNGQERGGMGAFADGRANVCLDYGTASKEAACVAVAPEDQYAAFILNGTPNEDVFDRVTMYVGADGQGSIKAFGGGANQGGVMIRAGHGRPSVTVYDSTGAALTDLASGVGR